MLSLDKENVWSLPVDLHMYEAAHCVAVKQARSRPCLVQLHLTLFDHDFSHSASSRAEGSLQSSGRS